MWGQNCVDKTPCRPEPIGQNLLSTKTLRRPNVIRRKEGTPRHFVFIMGLDLDFLVAEMSHHPKNLFLFLTYRKISIGGLSFHFAEIDEHYFKRVKACYHYINIFTQTD